MKRCSRKETEIFKNNKSNLTLVLSNKHAGEHIVTNMYVNKIINMLKTNTKEKTKENIIIQTIGDNISIFPETLLAKLVIDKDLNLVETLKPDLRLGINNGMRNIYKDIANKTNIDIINIVLNSFDNSGIINNIINQLDNLINRDESETTDIIIYGLDYSLNNFNNEDISKLKEYSDKHNINIILCLEIIIDVDNSSEMGESYINWLIDSNIFDIDIEKSNVNLVLAYEYDSKSNQDNIITYRNYKILTSIKDKTMVNSLKYLTINANVANVNVDISTLMAGQKGGA